MMMMKNFNEDGDDEELWWWWFVEYLWWRIVMKMMVCPGVGRKAVAALDSAKVRNYFPLLTIFSFLIVITISSFLILKIFSFPIVTFSLSRCSQCSRSQLTQFPFPDSHIFKRKSTNRFDLSSPWDCRQVTVENCEFSQSEETETCIR